MTCRYCGDHAPGGQLCDLCWSHLIGIQLPPEPDVKSLVLMGIKILAGVCDGARTLDGQGFDGRDTGFGKSVARQTFISAKQLPIAAKMIVKYHRQLPEEIWKPVREWKENHA